MLEEAVISKHSGQLIIQVEREPAQTKKFGIQGKLLGSEQGPQQRSKKRSRGNAWGTKGLNAGKGAETEWNTAKSVA